jgi:hypothetical protein
MTSRSSRSNRDDAVSVYVCSVTGPGMFVFDRFCLLRFVHGTTMTCVMFVFSVWFSFMCRALRSLFLLCIPSRDYILGG